MMYGLILIVAALLSWIEMPIHQNVLFYLVSLLASYLLFIEAARIRISLLVYAHKMPLGIAIFATATYFLLWYRLLPHEGLFVCALFLLVSAYDVRWINVWRVNVAIPHRVEQILFGDGAMRTLFAALLIGGLHLGSIEGIVYAVCIAGLSVLAVQFFRYMHMFQIAAFVIPPAVFFTGVAVAGDGIVAAILSGGVVGNMFRQPCGPILHKSLACYPILSACIVALFGYVYGPVLTKTFHPTIIMLAIGCSIFVHAVLYAIAFMFRKMQWETYLLAGMSALPSMLSLVLCLLCVPKEQGLLPTLIAYSMLIHFATLPWIMKWYGKIFTGRDLYSQLEEHRVVPKLPWVRQLPHHQDIDPRHTTQPTGQP